MKFINNLKYKKILLFTGLLLSFLSFEAIYYIIGIDLKDMTLQKYIILVLIKDIFFFMILMIIYRKYLKEKWHDFISHFKTYLSISFKDWLTGFLIMITSNSIINTFITNNIGENEAAVQALISTLPLFALLLTTIFAPFIEEMIFRKSLQDCFHNKYLYMIISGLIFGLVHVLGAANALEYFLIIPYGALGFMFAHTINTTDNIYCTIMMHMFHNGVLTILAMVI